MNKYEKKLVILQTLEIEIIWHNGVLLIPKIRKLFYMFFLSWMSNTGSFQKEVYHTVMYQFVGHLKNKKVKTCFKNAKFIHFFTVQQMGQLLYIRKSCKL